MLFSLTPIIDMFKKEKGNCYRYAACYACLAKIAAKAFPDADIEIVEKHHNQKLDAPSGTALALADSINEELNNEYEYVFDRSQVRQKRDKKEMMGMDERMCEIAFWRIFESALR